MNYCNGTTCVALPGLGEDCTDSFVCNSPDLYCEIEFVGYTGTCANRIAENQTCDPSQWDDPCQAGPQCDSVSSTCTPWDTGAICQ